MLVRPLGQDRTYNDVTCIVTKERDTIATPAQSSRQIVLHLRLPFALRAPPTIH